MEDRETYEDRLREEFQREVEIVRGAGGFAPTTDDLRAHGERLAYAALADSAPNWGWSVDDEREHHYMNLAYHFELRHETPEIRASLRESIRKLKALRA